MSGGLDRRLRATRPTGSPRRSRTLMASAWDLWLTPTISLSLIVEAESAVPSITRFISQWALYFQPYLVKQALEYEVGQRPELDVISAGTLRVVDYAYFRQTIAKRVSVSWLRVATIIEIEA